MGIHKTIDVSKRLNKLVSILFYSSILYIPIVYRMVGGDLQRLIGKVISNDTLHGGTFFHLWFINALIMGVILTNYMIKNVNYKLSMTFVVIILLGCWIGDIIKSLDVKLYIFYAFRSLISFSLVYIGYMIASKNLFITISNKVIIGTIVGGIILMLAEVYMLHIIFNTDMSERQFPIFCIPVCIAILLLCIKTNLKENIISNFGRDYSLGIYLIHPFVLYHVTHNIGGLFESNSLVKLFTAFILSILALSIIKKFVPIVYNKLNGIGIK
ncbi:hypothetical protein A9B99_03740 [Mangrovibacter phragmitis]|uniref:Acyltransferase 3 domain-containing protein n=2 Tax=Mangrovibacter phragmitis TaxID=1691903 RepID=A0A1B7L903_9ENTR|nr:hypothetical protein A9B99_03740 [Mangrovibacter phragmitis]